MTRWYCQTDPRPEFGMDCPLPFPQRDIQLVAFRQGLRQTCLGRPQRRPFELAQGRLAPCGGGCAEPLNRNRFDSRNEFIHSVIRSTMDAIPAPDRSRGQAPAEIQKPTGFLVKPGMTNCLKLMSSCIFATIRLTAFPISTGSALMGPWRRSRS
jgi:hypothetical protein